MCATMLRPSVSTEPISKVETKSLENDIKSFNIFTKILKTANTYSRDENSE